METDMQVLAHLVILPNGDMNKIIHIIKSINNKAKRSNWLSWGNLRTLLT